MDTINTVLIAVVITITFIFSVIALAIAVDTQNKYFELEKRVLVLETRVNIYSGSGCN